MKASKGEVLSTCEQSTFTVDAHDHSTFKSVPPPLLNNVYRRRQKFAFGALPLGGGALVTPEWPMDASRAAFWEEK